MTKGLRSIDKLISALEERAKELNCLYQVEDLLSDNLQPIENVYENLLDIIPTSTAEKIVSVGNAAGIGASAALLDINKRQTIIEAVEKVVKIETATEPRFQEFFVDAMKFSVSPVKQQETKKVRRRKRVS